MGCLVLESFNDGPRGRVVGASSSSKASSKKTGRGIPVSSSACWAAAPATPSGDDFLWRLVLPLRAAHLAVPKGEESLACLTGLIQSLAPDRTHLYGKSALHAARLGQGSEPATTALSLVLANNPDAPSALEELTRQGGTAGLNTLRGLLAGLQILESYLKPPPRLRAPRAHKERPKPPGRRCVCGWPPSIR